jgi:hypothetical protein
MTRIRFALLLALLAALVVGPAAAASASLGSVPAEVAAYVSDGSMVARLNDVYGKNAAGTEGIAFDDTTKAGPISRVYEWTADRLANKKTDHPVQLTNNWVVPITIGGKPVGVATIWINPQSVTAELAEFDPTPALATALAAVPDSAALVRDPVTHAWLALANGTVTPLIVGSSGLSTPVPVQSLTLSSSAPVPGSASGDPHTGIAVAIVVVALVVVILLVVLFVPRGRRRRAGAAAESAAVEPAPAESAPAVEPAGAVEPAPVESAAVSSAPARAPRSAPGTPVTKPVTSKPRAAATGGGSASTKPRVQKPPTQKPPTQKPPAAKPKPTPNPPPSDPEAPPPGS